MWKAERHDVAEQLAQKGVSRQLATAGSCWKPHAGARPVPVRMRLAHAAPTASRLLVSGPTADPVSPLSSRVQTRFPLLLATSDGCVSDLGPQQLLSEPAGAGHGQIERWKRVQALQAKVA